MTSPNPNWKPGDKINSPVNEMVTIEPEKVPFQEMYKLLIGSVVPRPIAFVSTMSEAGVGNLAPFSFFNGVSSNPPCIVISVTRKGDGEPKDTLRNIETTRQFVVNSANEWLVEPLVHCAGAFPYGVDEMGLVGLTPLASTRVKPPRVKESAIQMECELFKIVDVGDGSPGSSALIVGRIVAVHVHKPAYQNGRILLNELKPIARLGGTGYCTVGQTFDIPVPKVDG